MSELGFKNPYAKKDMLSYAEKIRLLGRIIQNLHVPVDPPFDLWKDRDISIKEILNQFHN